MITITHEEIKQTEITLSLDEAKEVTILYLQNHFGISNCWVENGKIYTNTSYDWYKGTITNSCLGDATEGQLLADKLLDMLQK